MHAGVISYVTEYSWPHSCGIGILSGDGAIIIVAFRQHNAILAWKARI
jgi:hypothetical protein